MGNGVVKLAIEFIEKLTPKDIEDLISKKVKFCIQDERKVKPSTKKVESIKKIDNIDNIEDIVNTIKQFNNRDEATNYIKGLGFTKYKLILLASELGIKIAKSNKKDKIIYIIVEDIVGNKLKIEGLKMGILGKSDL